jgi:hypothetical protein
VPWRALLGPTLGRGAWRQHRRGGA